MNSKTMTTTIVAALMFAALQARSGTTTWIGTGGDDLWTTPANWDGSAVPTLDNDVLIGASTSPVLLPAGQSAQVAAFKLGSGGDAALTLAGTLTMTNGVTISDDSADHTAVVVAESGGLFNWTRDCTIGFRKGTGILRQTGGAVSAASLTVGSSDYSYSTRSTSTGVVVADDFDLTLSGALTIGHQYTTGLFTNRNGGAINCGAVAIGRKSATGVLVLLSGSLTSSETITLGDWTYSDGMLVAADGTEVGAKNGITAGKQTSDAGTLDLGAMTLRTTAYGKALTIGSIDSKYYTTATGVLIMRGTTIAQGQAGKIVVNPRSTITGHGTATSSSTSSLDMCGKTTASGFGEDKDLTFTGYASIAQTYAGDGVNGWYAEKGGRLVLPSVAVGEGNSTNNLAEVKSAAELDLVNAVRVELVGGTAGALSYSLLAPDRGDVPEGLDLPKVVSVWKLGAPSFASASLTFKLTEVDAGGKLKLLRRVDRHWEVVGNVDAATRLARVENLLPLGDDNLGFFAVAPEVPFSGTMIVLQ